MLKILHKFLFEISVFNKANITQMIRVLGCGSKSRRFESCCLPRFYFLKGDKALNEFLNIKISKGVYKRKIWRV